jgi:hypothetical protein
VHPTTSGGHDPPASVSERLLQVQTFMKPMFRSFLCPFEVTAAPTLLQVKVRFGEKQTSAQNSFGFLLIEFLTILQLTDNTRANTLPTSSVYAQ